MLLRRKVCAAVIIAGILFLMLASQSIQKRNFLPLSIPLPVVWATPTGQQTGETGVISCLSTLKGHKELEEALLITLWGKLAFIGNF